MSLLQSLTRIIAFVGAELVAVVRRPSALVALVFGPFLIMAIFGLGYQGVRPNIRAAIVIPPTSGLPGDIRSYSSQVSGLTVTAVSPTIGPAEQELRDHKVDAVIIYPADLMNRFKGGTQATIEAELCIVNPTQLLYADEMANQLATFTNQQLIAHVVAAGESVSLGSVRIPPDVVAAPMRADVRNLAPVSAGVVTFYGPAVLILILQHMSVTLVSLSLLSERKSGIFELFRISPRSAWEIIVGKLIAFAIIGGVVAATSMALLVLALHVLILGSMWAVALIIGLVLVASIGIGLLLGVAADSERSAVQASQLILLASVFFSGFIIELNLFVPGIRVASSVLPATQGIALLQNALLIGSIDVVWPLYALAGIAIVTVLAAWALLRRSMAAIS